LRDVPERSRRNQRDRDRQPGVERWDQHLLLDSRGGICERPAVQRIRWSCKSPLCCEADPVSFTVRGRGSKSKRQDWRQWVSNAAYMLPALALRETTPRRRYPDLNLGEPPVIANLLILISAQKKVSLQSASN
jgi:hypothetical protein